MELEAFFAEQSPVSVEYLWEQRPAEALIVSGQ